MYYDYAHLKDEDVSGLQNDLYGEVNMLFQDPKTTMKNDRDTVWNADNGPFQGQTLFSESVHEARKYAKLVFGFLFN